jgi:hypothetical protein
VPVLIFSGSRDVRTPTAGARRVAARFPQSRLVVVAGSGHAVTEQSACADAYVAAWVQGEPHPPCPRLPLALAPLRSLPRAPVGGGGRLTAAQTLIVAAATVREAEAIWVAAEGLSVRVGGLAGGVLHATPSDSFALERYADVAGVALSGAVTQEAAGQDGFAATVAVGGTRALAGRLRLVGGRLSGELGGRAVSIPGGGVSASPRGRAGRPQPPTYEPSTVAIMITTATSEPISSGFLQTRLRALCENA